MPAHKRLELSLCRCQLRLRPLPHLRVRIILQHGKAVNAARFKLGKQRHADATEKARQAFGAGRAALETLMALIKVAAQGVKILPSQGC